MVAEFERHLLSKGVDVPDWWSDRSPEDESDEWLDVRDCTYAVLFPRDEDDEDDEDECRFTNCVLVHHLASLIHRECDRDPFLKFMSDRGLEKVWLREADVGFIRLAM